MYTNIEFLDTEPIENVITCMHYQMDKVIFFGYEEVIAEYKLRTEEFLKSYCDVKKVEFYPVSKNDLAEVMTEMEKVVKKEQELENKIYFDITGGESLFLVAFGILSEKMDLPMHMYDICEDKLINMGKAHTDSIEKNDSKEAFVMDLSKYIALSGAAISKNRDTSHVNVNDETFMQKASALWNVMLAYKDEWNYFCSILKDHLNVEGSLEATVVIDQSMTRNLAKFHKFMMELKKTGAIQRYQSQILERENNWITKTEVSISYASEAVKECLIKSGTILELHVYEEMKNRGMQCAQSVHVDWDGIEHMELGRDVLNEIDVLAVEGNIPVFISCKSGKLAKGKALEPLYELETVASRFGGKYARKVLATLQPITGVYAERAEEMGIELWCYGE